MCNRTQIKLEFPDAEKRFNAIVENPEALAIGNEINAFAHQATPVITNEQPNIISSDYHWGLIPFWAKDCSIRKGTVNAKIETLDKLPSFRSCTTNRCLIIVTGFYEWHWNDEKGKSKQKYEIHSGENEIFAIAGLYSHWNDPATNERIGTYTMVTTEANEKMKYIHNIKQRMPIVLKQSDEKHWLDASIPYQEFAFPKYDSNLFAMPV